MKQSLLLITTACTIVSLSGCGSSSAPSASATAGGGTTANSSENYYGSPLPASGGTVSTLQDGCDWFKVFDYSANPDQGNTAFPDTNAVYWVATGPTNPTADESIEIHGKFPSARYFSLQDLNQAEQVVDKLVDYSIQPDAGSSNPFVGPSQIDTGISPGGSYSANLLFQSAPSQPAPNTLYRGTGTGLSQNAVTTILLYRTYLPSNAVDPTGGAGLPKLTFHSASGDTPLSASPDAASCRQLAANFIAGQSGNAPPTVTLSIPTIPPRFAVYNGVAGGLLGQGQAKNADAAYEFARTTLLDGNIVLVRGRAPSFATQAGAPSIPDMRYWSMCENDYNTQHVISCVADQNAVIDSSGFYNVVISTTAARPANANAASGFNWLPWGPQTASILIYRNLLPATSFTQAIQNVGPLQSPANVMGDYQPVATYCPQATFEAAAGQTPDQVFAACQAAGGLLSGLGLGG